VSLPARTPSALPLQLQGSLLPLAKVASRVDGHAPTRPMAGWATVWAQILPDGTLVPVIDRDEQTMDCAAELAGIDWSAYLQRSRGFWNDCHKGNIPGNRAIKVGMGRILQFHDADSPFAREHGKVGWWTAGHLWDRADPASWQLYTDYIPTSIDLDRADAYWRMAQQLDGTERPLGFSVDGRMRTSPCGKRIIWARVEEIALAPGPSNPACTVEPLAVLAKASKELGAQGLAFLPAGLIGRNATPDACGTCSCGPNACGLRRLVKSDSGDVAPMAVESHGGAVAEQPVAPPPTDLRRLLARVRKRYGLDEPGAIRALRHFLAGRGLASTEGDSMDGQTAATADELNALAKGAERDPETAAALEGLSAALAKGEEMAGSEEMAKEEDEGGEGGEGGGEPMDKGYDENEKVEDEDSGQTEDEDSEQAEEENEDKDGLEKGAEGLYAGLDALMGLMAGVPALAKSVESLHAGMVSLLGTVDDLAKSVAGQSSDLAVLKKGVAGLGEPLSKALAGVTTVATTTKAIAKGVARGLELSSEAVELGKATGRSRIPDANANAAALRAGLDAASAANSPNELKKGLNLAISLGLLTAGDARYQTHIDTGIALPSTILDAIKRANTQQS